MYRGIIQHARFMTDHLREYALERDLHYPFGTYGRIYRSVRDDQEVNYQAPKFSEMTASEAAEYLVHENGLLRDFAQQVLVQCSPESITGHLESRAGDPSVEAYSRLHALWTLEGYDRSVYSENELTELALQSLEAEHTKIGRASCRERC